MDGNPFIDEIDAALKTAQQPQDAPPIVGTGLNPAPPGQPDYQSEIATALAGAPSSSAPPQPYGPPAPVVPYDVSNAFTHGATLGLIDPARALAIATNRYFSGRTPDFNYPEAATEVKAGREAFEAAHPYVNLAANVAGSLAGPAGSAANLIRGASSLGKVALSTGTGGLIGGVQGAAENATSVPAALQGATTGAEWGAGTGAAFPILGEVGSALFPRLSPEVQALRAAGIQPTPGRAVGGIPGALENIVAQVPFVGSPIQAARAQVQSQLNRAAVNQPLAEIGERLNSDTKTGFDAIAEMQTKLKNAFNQAVPTAGGAIDSQALTDINDALANAKFLAAPERAEFEKMVQNRIVGNFQSTPTGTANLSGPDFQDIDQILGQQAHKFLKSDNPYHNNLGDAYLDLQGKMRDWLQRVSPQNAADLQAANQAWRMAQPVQAAARASNDPNGLFTTAQLRSASRAASSIPQFASGGALMQQLANNAEMFVPKPGGSHVADVVGGGVLGAALLEHGPEILNHPYLFGTAALAYPALKAAYSNLGRRAITGLLGAVGSLPPGIGAGGPVAAQLAAQFAPVTGPYASGLLNTQP